MSSPEEVAEKAFGGKWEVTSLANEFEKGRKQGALEVINLLQEKINYIERFLCADIFISEFEKDDYETKLETYKELIKELEVKE